MQRTNSIFLFPITIVLYLIVGIAVPNFLLDKDLGQEAARFISFSVGISCLIIFLIISIVAIIIICKDNIDKKWKLSLCFSWILFTPIYLTIYYTKFRVIFANKLTSKDNFSLRKTNITSFLSFLLLFIMIGTFIPLTLFPIKNENSILYTLTIFFLLSVFFYFFLYFLSLYLSMFNDEPKISYVSRIPFAYSFIWMYSKKI